MGILEQISDMKKRGMSNEGVIDILTQQGFSPQEILNALNKLEFKNTVPGGYPTGEMDPSIMPEGEFQQGGQREYEEPVYQPQEYQEANQLQSVSPTQYYPRSYTPQENPTEGYNLPETNADMVIEIADQIFSEKIKKTQEVVETTSEAVILLQNKIENISGRLSRIESIIDKLQLSILEKVGSYGQNIDSIKKEMSMMQESFSKMISSKPSEGKENRKTNSKKDIKS